MELTTFLAQLIGLYLLIVGVMMLLRRKMLLSVYPDIFSSPALSLFIGALTLLMGLLLVLNHNVWQGTVATIITIVGWLTLLKGFLYVFFLVEQLKALIKLLQNKTFYYTLAVIDILIGIYLTSAGFAG